MRVISYVRDWLKARNTGFIPEEPDERDYQYVSGESKLPNKVDLRPYFLTPRNQKYTQACTGFAIAGVLEYYLNKEFSMNREVSPLHLWYFGKKLHGWEKDNKGVWLRNSFKALFNEGFVYEFNFPFKPDYLREPTRGNTYIVVELSKMLLREMEYQSISTYQVKDALSKGRPIIFGIKLNSSFYGNKTGKIKNITPSNNSHAMCLVGYDNSTNCYIARNSWDTSWGDDGYCYIPYDYFNEHSHERRVLNYKVKK